METSVETLLADETHWTRILAKSELQGHTENLFEIDSPYAFTHLRFHIYPDGGVSRLRLRGRPV